MKRLIIFLLLFAAIKVAGQTTGYFRFDTVRFFKQGGTCELYLINSTKDSLGLLTNIGGGLTRFIKSRASGDTLFVGLDTLVVVTSPENTNLGTAYRWLHEPTQGIRTVAPSNTILWDSTSTANSLTAKADTSVLATQYDITQIAAEGIQPTLVAGDTANRKIIFKDIGDSATTHNFANFTIVPPNYNIAYASPYGTSGLFNIGYSYTKGVNPTSNRANIVYSLLSYNQNAGSGGRLNSNEASFGFRAESHFEMNGAQPHFEFHFPEIDQSDGFSYRPFSWYIQKNARTATLNQTLTTGTWAYLNTSGTADTLLYSMGASGHAFGTMGNFALSLTNRRATGNAFSVTLDNDGPIIQGTGISQNRIVVPNIQGTGYIRNTNTYGGNVLLEQTGLTSHLRFLPTNQAISTRAGIFNQVTATEVTYIGIGINSSFLFGNGVTANTGGSAFFTTNNGVPSIQFATKAAASTTDIVAGVFGQNGNFAVGGGAVVSPVSEVSIYERSFSGTNTAPTMMSLITETSGTPASGLGGTFDWRVENLSAVNAILAEDVVEYVGTPTNAAETGARVFRTKIAGTMAERLRITGAGLLSFGGATSSFPALQRSSANLIVRLADNSANTDLEVLDEAYDATAWNGSNEVPTKNAVRDKIESLNISTGTYTPTLTNVLNVDASSVEGTVYYQRIGNQVTVWGTLSIDPTAASTLTDFAISLPIASALTTFSQLSGNVNSFSTGGGHGTITGDATNDRAQVDFENGTRTTTTTYTFRFSYEVL